MHSREYHISNRYRIMSKQCEEGSILNYVNNTWLGISRRGFVVDMLSGIRCSVARSLITIERTCNHKYLRVIWHRHLNNRHWRPCIQAACQPISCSIPITIISLIITHQSIPVTEMACSKAIFKWLVLNPLRHFRHAKFCLSRGQIKLMFSQTPLQKRSNLTKFDAMFYL